MADIDRKKPNLDSSKAAAADATNAKRDEHIEHHLRGGEFDDDFADADQDSCVAAHRRNSQESDS